MKEATEGVKDGGAPSGSHRGRQLAGVNGEASSGFPPRPSASSSFEGALEMTRRRRRRQGGEGPKRWRRGMEAGPVCWWDASWHWLRFRHGGLEA